MAKKAYVTCNMCNNSFKIFADDAIIQKQFSGSIKVTVKCPCCNNQIVLYKTPEFYNLLKGRIEKNDFDETKGFDPVLDAYIEEFQ